MGFSSNAHIAITRENRRLQKTADRGFKARRDRGREMLSAPATPPPPASRVDYRARQARRRRGRWVALAAAAAMAAMLGALLRWLPS